MIIINNEAALRISCQDVSLEEIPTLIFTLENELNYANRFGKNGIGLAAPQIGISKKISIIRYNDFSINLINSKIIHSYDSAIFREEGCLSFPGRVEDTSRFQEVHITNLVEPYNFIATGLLAVICQHEIDHVSGSLFMDHSIPKPKKKVGPNDPCICGKSIKYKKCCGRL